MPNWKDKLKQTWNENPLQCIMIASVLAVTAGKVAESAASVRSKNAYAKQINQKHRNY